jgi:hypothetical protein
MLTLILKTIRFLPTLSMDHQAPASFFLTMAFLVITILITVISRMLIFEKAGRSNVSAFIPILNLYVMLRITGMKKIWTLFYGMTLINLFLSLKALMPLLMPDEVVENRFSILSFFTPFVHPQHIHTLFIVFWSLNALYFFMYVRLHIRLSRLFKYSILFGIGMALLEPVFYPILAFGKAEMKGGV